MSVNDFLLDFAVASVFIMIGQFLRAKVGFIQRFFIPASMLAALWGWHSAMYSRDFCPCPIPSALIPVC